MNLIYNQKPSEVIKGLKENSEIIILDFAQIERDIPDYKNIQLFFKNCENSGVNPRSPEERQKFNNEFIKKSSKKFLIGRYGEDRKEMLKGSSIGNEGRTIHLGIDVFSIEEEDIYSPFDGEIVKTGYEPGPNSYGNYVIIKHKIDETFYTFYGHLSNDLPPLGVINAGNKIGKMGHYLNLENGGWSIHLHFQLLREMPLENQTPIGYSKKEDFKDNKLKYPDPGQLLQLK